jgi:electron transfer flavoprotein alpha subunit
MNEQRQVLALVPLAWGDDALAMVLGAAQHVASEAGLGFSVLLLGAVADEQALSKAVAAGAKHVCQALHNGLSSDAAALAQVAADALSRQPEVLQRLILVPPGADGEELAARLAAVVNVQALGRCNSLSWTAAGFEVERAVWGGRKRLQMLLPQGSAVACLRVGKASLSATAAASSTGLLELNTPLPAALAIEETTSGQRLPPVESAKIVVSGGRGVNEQGFALLERLAETLQGSLGGSLPAVDAGMVPVVRQVGVSGKFVSPEVYLAVGISGTPQHLAGISLDSRIVAINKDPAADIFRVAQVGVVAEWEQLLPVMLDALAKDAAPSQ